MFSTKVKITGILQISTDSGTTWISLPDPASMEIQKYDLDSEDGSGRNQQGTMFRDRKAIKEKLVISYPPMFGDDILYFMTLVRNVNFSVKYFSPWYGVVRTATMYAGDISIPTYNMFDVTKTNNLYQSWKMNFIEV